ncbi:ABC transporter substrate-binding protein [Bradyrhizobium sp. DASA03007]|uniref:ABC transporter substrate-binding protein n=3 Tax=unclassified Bradyrhizobium TaxID=2631580 RepID=UPI003F7152A4
MMLLARIAAVASLVLSMHAVANAQPVTIKLSWVVPVTNWGSIVLEKKDLMQNNGKTYKLEVTHFRGTSEALQGLASGDLNIADISTTGFAVAYENGVKDVSIIAGELQDGIPEYYSTEFLVRNSSNIRTIPDLKGKTIAVSARGSANYMLLIAMLRKNNIDERKDVNIVEAAAPTMGAMLKSGKVDLIAVTRPFSAQPEVRDGTSVLFTAADAVGECQSIVWVAKKTFIEKNRAALIDFLADMRRVAHWFSDPANHAEVVKIAAKVTKMPETAWQEWLFTKADFYRDPNMMPNVAAMQANLELMKKLEIIKQPINLSDAMDLSLVEAAMKRE